MRKSVRLFLLLSLLLAATVAPVQAEYWKGEVYYYSDACYTNQIGYFVRYCNNATSQWGQQSAYAVHYDFNCGPIEP